jgi:cyclopropane-fatty-acyl-phospholipid synthase
MFDGQAPREEPVQERRSSGRFRQELEMRIAQRLLAPADIRLDGSRPWDIQLHDPRAIGRALLHGSVGFGEGYVDGQWSTRDLEELCFRLARATVDDTARLLPSGLFKYVASRLSNHQTRRNALTVVKEHYDFGNDLFFSFLGSHKNYSCGYFPGTTELDKAQQQKLELICQKLELKPGERLLDVGGGWGEFARYAASQHGVRVTSINLSESQMQFAREHCRGLNVEIVRSDYRDMRGEFDKIAAIAMFTHVGYKNYRTFMTAMRQLLKPNGIFLMEGVWGNRSVTHIDGWMDKYIFPNACIPSGAQTFAAFEGLFVAEDLHNFGPSYLSTLRAWNRNFNRSWPELSARYDERVRRIFEFFFMLIAGFFRARALQNWHLVLTPVGRAQPNLRR